MPGIHDAHTHLVSGLSAWEVSIAPMADEAQIIAALKAWDQPCPEDHLGNRWVVGGRYWPDSLTQGGPHKAFLDEAFPDQPVVINDRSAHSILVNSTALRLAGIDETTTFAGQGEIVRDADGAQTGVLHDMARGLIYAVIGQHSPAVLNESVQHAVHLQHRYGVTSVQDASSTRWLLRSLTSLEEAGTLNLHVAGHLVWRDVAFGLASREELDDMITHHDEFSTALIDTSFVKFWLDGQPIEPYLTHATVCCDGSVDRTHLLVPQDEMNEAIARFDKAGLTVKIHCAGDGAVRSALDAFEHVRTVNGPGGPHHELAHCGKVTAPDFDRFAPLNVGIEMSPAVWHLPEQGVSEDFSFDEAAASGALLTFGTDWSVSESPNLFPAIQGTVQHGEHSIDLETAIAAVTINGARAVGMAEERGTLEAGKLADFIVLDRNIFTGPVDAIGGTRVLQTIFGGTVVHQAEAGR